MMKAPLIAPLLWILAAGLALSGCMLRSDKEDPAKQSGKDKMDKPEAVPVEVAAIERGPIEESLRLPTSLEAEEEVKVLSRSSNRVKELLVEEGDEVEAGQLLLRLENEIQTIALAKAKNNLAKAKAEYERQRPLYEQKLISEQAFADLQFELKTHELNLADAQRELDYTEVRAPITGTITHRLVKLGDYVTVNQHLFDIVDFNSIVALVYHPEKYLTRFSISQPARVRCPTLGEEVYPAYVKRIAPVVESRTGTIKITLGFKETGALRPGLHVDTEIVLDTFTNALLIPKRALVYDGDQTFVFRLKPERKVERTAVQAKLTDKLHLTPVEGFEEGDQIVVAGQTGLKDGALVRLPGDPDPKEEKEQDKKEASDKKASPPEAEAKPSEPDASAKPKENQEPPPPAEPAAPESP